MLYTTLYVTNISAEKEEKGQGPRVFGPVRDKNRPEGAFEEASKRQEEIIGLNPRPGRGKLCFLKRIGPTKRW